MPKDNGEKIVLIVGAGGSVADCGRMPKLKRPPLDRGFFDNALRAGGGAVVHLAPVIRYIYKNYRYDVTDERYDSLERVMAAIYTDIYGGSLVDEAFIAFRSLVKAFLSRLAVTTRDVHMHRQRRLYRLIAQQLRRCRKPDNLAIVTFNQDIQIEKALDAIAKTKQRQGQDVFAFPGCYRLPFAGNITGLVRGDRFRVNRDLVGVSVLKLHGSLNWYSSHNTPDIKRRAMFDPMRKINITTRKALYSEMKLRAKTRARFMFPLVVPPVVHKSGILHKNLQDVWVAAEEKLREAERVIVFGYSCPINDWEAANLLGRTIGAGAKLKEFSVIDPSASVLLRYVELAKLEAVNYYASCDAYLSAE